MVNVKYQIRKDREQGRLNISTNAYSPNNKLIHRNECFLAE